MSFLYLLEKIRNPFFDALFSFITMLGEETVFLVLAIFIFWCVNKREGYFILSVGLVGIVINQAAKLFFRVPRPWVIDPEFTIVESARAEATGYSFPSGHTQNVTGTLGAIASMRRKVWGRVALISLILLVSFSRMYLGVHTPRDVLFSLLLGVALVLLLKPVFDDAGRFERFFPYVIGAAALLTVLYGVYAYTFSDGSVDASNLDSARENAAVMLGCAAALVPVYILDRYVIKFETRAPWYAQILKTGVGLLAVLAIRVLLKEPLNLLFGNVYVGRGVRYFLMVAFAGGLWPLTFGWFARLKIAPLERFGKWAVSKLSRGKDEKSVK